MHICRMCELSQAAQKAVLVVFGKPVVPAVPADKNRNTGPWKTIYLGNLPAAEFGQCCG